jgi:thiol-disulfide isomerase/thioredoxin
VLVLACLVLCAGCKSPNPSRLQPGDEAPPLVVSQWAQGGPVDVTDGQRIYVLEFFASWCPWCRMQEGRLSRLQERYADRGVQFVAITNESAEDIGAYLAEGGGDFDLPVAVDDNDTTFALYGPQKIPRVFVIGQDGIIAYEGHPGSPAFVATLNQLTR